MCWPSCQHACWRIVRRQRRGFLTAKCAHSTNAFCCLPPFSWWRCWSVGGGTDAALGTKARTPLLRSVDEFSSTCGESCTLAAHNARASPARGSDKRGEVLTQAVELPAISYC